MKMIAALSAVFLVNFTLVTHGTNPLVIIFIWAWVISAWEWGYKPMFLAFLKYIKGKIKKKAVDK